MYHAECAQEGSDRINPPACPQEIEETQPAETSLLIRGLSSEMNLEPVRTVVSLTSAILIRERKPIGAAPTNKLWAG